MQPPETNSNSKPVPGHSLGTHTNVGRTFTSTPSCCEATVLTTEQLCKTCMTKAKEHFLIHTQPHFVKQPFSIHRLPKKQMLEKQQNFQILKKEKKIPGCQLRFLSTGIQWRVPVSIYIQMSPSIFPEAGDGFTLSTMMRLTNLSSPSERQACDAQ